MADTAQPARLAEILISQVQPQLPQLLPLPIEDVARACGILEIKPLETDGFEGGLIQDEVKKHGYVLIKAGRHESRTRFTVAHELGHFVNLRHVAKHGQSQLLCSKEDMQASGVQKDRLGMEAQANEFAANVLMPKSILGTQPFMQGSAELGRILQLQALCNVSKEAAARRYAELHGGDFAIVFSKDGKLIAWPVRGGDFPWLEVKAGQTLFRDTLTRTFSGAEQDVSEQEETDSAWWLSDVDRDRWDLWEEVLIQRQGHRMTLLVGERKSGFDGRLRERWTPRFR